MYAVDFGFNQISDRRVCVLSFITVIGVIMMIIQMDVIDAHYSIFFPRQIYINLINPCKTLTCLLLSLS